jgi:hypothetical protein
MLPVWRTQNEERRRKLHDSGLERVACEIGSRGRERKIVGSDNIN